MNVVYESAGLSLPGRRMPLVTFSVCCYQQERYIEEALNSAFAQTYSPLEIVVSDDCSRDSTFEIAKNMVEQYRGPHKVILNRNEVNLGLAGNINKIWELASGEFLVSQAGDDVSFPHRTAALVEAWLSREPRPDLVYSGLIQIDENGNRLAEVTDVITETPGIEGTVTGRKIFIAGGQVAAYARAVHFNIGPLNDDVGAEDFVYSFRALLGNGIAGIPEPLVKYRIHSKSIIGKNWRIKKQDVDVQAEKKHLETQYSILKEYKRAMQAHGITNLYLRWRLARSFKTVEILMDGYTGGFTRKLFLLLWAGITIRPRVFKSMLRETIRQLLHKR